MPPSVFLLPSRYLLLERYRRTCNIYARSKRDSTLGLVHLRAGSSLIDLVTHDGKLGSQGGALAGREGRNVDHLCLRIEPFDEAAIRARMARHGVPVHGEVQNNFGAEGNGPSIYLEDPDGNGVELKGPAA
ncbi:VOC family protein [Variovorax boronicumulans]